LGWSALGMVFKDGIVLACERKIKSKLLVPKSIEKIHELDSHIACAVSGLFADAKTLMTHARSVAAVLIFNIKNSCFVVTLVCI